MAAGRSALVLLLALLLPAAACGQYADSHLWLVGAPGLSFNNQVLELDRDGNVVASWPASAAGGCTVAKDLLGRIVIADCASQTVSLYRSGIGLLATFATPFLSGFAVMPSGDYVAVFRNMQNPLLPGWIQAVPLSGGAWPPLLSAGGIPIGVTATSDDVAWALTLLPSQLFRLQYGLPIGAVPLGAVSSATPRALVPRPGGGVLVSFQGSPTVAVVAADGTLQPSIVLAEPPLSMTTDGDRSLVVLGASGTIRRIDLVTKIEVDSFLPPPTNDVGAVIADQRAVVWVEDVQNARLHRIGWDGEVIATIQLPLATRTGGDPMGFQFAAVVAPWFDADQDGALNGDELHRGSILTDPADVPPTLSLLGTSAGTVTFGVSAPGRGGRLTIPVLSVSGASPSPFGLAGAPYLDLTFDDVSTLTLLGQASSTPFLGVDQFVLDAAGQGSFALTFPTLPIIPGSLTIYAGAAVVQPATTVGGLTDVVTNTVAFTNP